MSTHTLRTAVEAGGTWAQIGARVGLNADTARGRAVRAGLKRASGSSEEPVPALKGVVPGVEWNGSQGTLTTGPMTGAPDWTDLLRVWDLDPAVYEVVGDPQFRAWDAQTPDGLQRLYYYKATIRRRVAAEDREDIEALIEEVRAHVSPPLRSGDFGEDAFVLAVADAQIGKPDGDGTKGTVERFMAGIDAAVERIDALRDAGHSIDTGYILSLGDIIESCAGHYPQQTFGVELNRRDQVKLARRLFLHAVRRLAPEFSSLVVAGVGGNHGENRINGKSFTDFADNDDVALLEQVAEIVEENPQAYGHVRFEIPNADLSLVLDVAGTKIGLAHGHQFTKGATPAQKAVEWWKAQAYGEQPIGDASILLSGHYHHLLVQQEGTKTHIQCPALDGGSEWFTNQRGVASKAGLVSFRVGPAGWSDLQVL